MESANLMNIVIVDAMNNCGCNPTPEHYQEFPIFGGKRSDKTLNIPQVKYPTDVTEIELKKKVIKEFCSIMKALECGQHQNLEFLLEEISLISRNKYKQNSDLFSQEDVLDPTFNELHINLDDITPEQLEALLTIYKDLMVVLQGPKGERGPEGPQGPKGADGVMTFQDLTPEQLEQLRGPQGDPGFITEQQYLDIIRRLEALENGLNPSPNPSSGGIGYAFTSVKPTASTLVSYITLNADKPSGPQTVDLTYLLGPTSIYLVYPLSWESILNEAFRSPKILDASGFECGAYIDEQTPTITVGGVNYRILDLEVGKGVYTIEFK